MNDFQGDAYRCSSPQKHDAVLGGKVPIPSAGVILGGLDGLKRRLASKTAEHRIAALPETLNYGQQGLNLLIRSLKDEVESVQWVAYNLLRDRPEPRVKWALELFSDSGINYRRLKNLLTSGQWQEADRVTTAIMQSICGVQASKRLNPEHIRDFPARDLQIINHLWTKHSGNKFGLTIQQQIWRNCEQRRWDKGEVWILFGDRVGWRIRDLFTFVDRWRRYEELDFSTRAAVGHLPYISGIFTIEAIANRLDNCIRN